MATSNARSKLRGTTLGTGTRAWEPQRPSHTRLSFLLEFLEFTTEAFAVDEPNDSERGVLSLLWHGTIGNQPAGSRHVCRFSAHWLRTLSVSAFSLIIVG